MRLKVFMILVIMMGISNSAFSISKIELYQELTILENLLLKQMTTLKSQEKKLKDSQISIVTLKKYNQELEKQLKDLREILKSLEDLTEEQAQTILRLQTDLENLRKSFMETSMKLQEEITKLNKVLVMKDKQLNTSKKVGWTLGTVSIVEALVILALLLL